MITVATNVFQVKNEEHDFGEFNVTNSGGRNKDGRIAILAFNQCSGAEFF